MKIKNVLASILLGLIGTVGAIVLMYMMLTYFPGAMITLLFIGLVAIVSASIYDDLKRREKAHKDEGSEETDN